MSANKRSTHTDWTDPDDAPALDDAFFDRADEYKAGQLVKRGRGRPKAEETKERITIRLSPQVLEEFRESGPGWQGRIDEALKDWLKTHQDRA